MEADGARGLLLEAARSFLHGMPSPGLRRLCAEADAGSAFIELAADQGMTAVLLQAAGTQLPPEVRDALRAGALAQAQSSLQLSGELVRLLDVLRDAGVDALAYKGPVLAVQAYGDVGMRRFSDLDLLVDPADAARARAALAAEGYAAHLDFTAREHAAFTRVDGDYQLVHGQTGTLVELHCRVASRRFLIDLPTSLLVHHAEPTAIGAWAVRGPSRVHHVLILAHHGAKHRWRRIEWLLSFALMVRPLLEDERLAVEAERAGCTRELMLALALAERLLGLELSGDARRLIAAGRLDALVDEAAHELTHGSDADAATDANLLFNYRLKRGAAARLRYAAWWLFVPTPEDWMAAPLPAPLHPLYALVRPARLLARYGRLRGRGRPPR